MPEHYKEGGGATPVVTSVRVKNFTAFESLRADFGPGVNLITGPNGSGKTHLLKVIYAATSDTMLQVGFKKRLCDTLQPSGGELGRLVRKYGGLNKASVEVHRGDLKMSAKFSRDVGRVYSRSRTQERKWYDHPVETAFIPSTETLAFASGWMAAQGLGRIEAYDTQVWAVRNAYLPPLREPARSMWKPLLLQVQKMLGGIVVQKGGSFFLRGKGADVEFALLSNSMRKLGLLWLLMQNGTVYPGSVLLWDSFDSEMHHYMCLDLVEVLFGLSRGGVQVFLSAYSSNFCERVVNTSKKEGADRHTYLVLQNRFHTLR